jgi:hypothetical protein
MRIVVRIFFAAKVTQGTLSGAHYAHILMHSKVTLQVSWWIFTCMLLRASIWLNHFSGNGVPTGTSSGNCKLLFLSIIFCPYGQHILVCTFLLPSVSQHFPSNVERLCVVYFHELWRLCFASNNLDVRKLSQTIGNLKNNE